MSPQHRPVLWKNHAQGWRLCHVDHYGEADLWVLVFDDFEQCKVELLHNDPHDTDAILVRDSSIALDDVGVIYAGQKVNFTLEIIDDDFASEPCPNNFKAVGSPYLLSWTLTALAGSSHGSPFLVSAAAACGALGCSSLWMATDRNVARSCQA